MKKSKTLILLLLFVVASTNVYAVQDSIIPLTAKTAWNLVYKQVEVDYGVPPILFKAFPEKEIDQDDTILCSVAYTQDGLRYKYWNGISYTWIFECRIPALSKDSMFRISIYSKILTPPFITIETIYKPITRYADTIGIAEGTWFDSDSIYKIPQTTKWIIFPIVYLERGFPYGDKQEKTMWNMEEGYDNEKIAWLSIDALTGKIVKFGVVSVSEPSIFDGITFSPNPTSTTFTISGIDGVSSLRIMNSLGMEVKQLSMVNGQLSIDVSDLASGVYFVQFRSQTGVVSKPIVVSR